MTNKIQPEVALYVENFLPYTHSWIYRQISDSVSNMKLVLCNKRSEAQAFTFEPCVSVGEDTRLKKYIIGRFWPLFKYRLPALSMAQRLKLRRALLDHQINLVHSHFGTNGTLISEVCKELNIPLVVTFHGHDISSTVKRWPGYAKALSELFIQIKYAIAISEEMAGRLRELGCPEEKIKVSYLGVPLEDFPYFDRSSRPGPTRFLHAGRLTAKKGVPDIIKAFAKAFPIPGTAILDIAGDGEEKELVMNTLQKTKPANKVNLLGRLSNEELLQARYNADVFLLNCRTDAAGTKEGLPISTLEAAATGLPVIGTIHAGIPESIIDKVTGILIPEYENDALAEAMIQLSDKNLQITMGSNARKFIEEKFGLSKCNQTLKSIYNSSI